MIRLDLSNFFPSVSEETVRGSLALLGASEQVANTLVRLVTLPEGLPQGAPTSVAVADMVLFPLDVRLDGMAKKHGFTYSRYVDDLTVSGGQRVRGFERLTRRIVTDMGWKLNDKGGFVGRGERHDLLGAVVNDKPNVSREYFGEVRSYLRLVAKGHERPDERAFRSLESKVMWILSLNPNRERVLHPLLLSARESRRKSGELQEPKNYTPAARVRAMATC